VSAIGAPPVRGLALGLWGTGRPATPGNHQTERGRFDRAIDEIAALGATHVALVATWSQRDVRDVRVAPGSRTIDDATLRHAIERARRADLAVLVFPILTLDRVSPGEWRGTLAPADVDAWWQSYERFILHYAGIAADTGAEALLIGSELGTTEAWRDRWYHLISRVERVYGGSLVYSANWDHYQHVSFWPRLDAIGVTGYFELAPAPGRDPGRQPGRAPDQPRPEALVQAWQRVRDDLVAFAAARGKPLWLTEVGYASVDGAAARPWDYGLDGPVDVEEQRRCYAAFIEAWSGVDALAGVFFWIWDGAGGSRDRGYTPRGKPAEALLRQWLSGT
jgi:hypothetical protein